MVLTGLYETTVAADDFDDGTEERELIGGGFILPFDDRIDVFEHFHPPVFSMDGDDLDA
jgi:hypothetical protein